jgi:hypothetical protein
MPRPDQQSPHNPKVPPQFDNSDTDEPQAEPSEVAPASPTGDARSGEHGGEMGDHVKTGEMGRKDVERERPKAPM